MRGILRGRPSPALVISVIALFVSLGGVSYGVATGFIDGREIRNNTVRTQDIRNNDVRGKDIRNSTIRTRDVGLNTLRGSDIAESTLGTVPNATTLGGIQVSGFFRYGAAISSGATARGAFGAVGAGASGDIVSFPLPAPVNLTDDQIRFKPDSEGADPEEDPRCSGTSGVPTAPGGLVCLYPLGAASDLNGTALGPGTESRFGFQVTGAGDFSGTWAYTAP